MLHWPQLTNNTNHFQIDPSPMRYIRNWQKHTDCNRRSLQLYNIYISLTKSSDAIDRRLTQVTFIYVYRSNNCSDPIRSEVTNRCNLTWCQSAVATNECRQSIIHSSDPIDRRSDHHHSFNNRRYRFRTRFTPKLKYNVSPLRSPRFIMPF